MKDKIAQHKQNIENHKEQIALLIRLIAAESEQIGSLETQILVKK